jgi:hypothetical protein
VPVIIISLHGAKACVILVGAGAKLAGGVGAAAQNGADFLPAQVPLVAQLEDGPLVRRELSQRHLQLDVGLHAADLPARRLQRDRLRAGLQSPRQTFALPQVIREAMVQDAVDPVEHRLKGVASKACEVRDGANEGVLQDVKCALANISIQKRDDNSQFTAALDFHADLAAGPHRTDVIIEAKFNGSPDITRTVVPVQLFVAQPIEAVPSAINSTVRDENSAQEETIVLYSRTKEPFVVNDVKSETEAVSVRRGEKPNEFLVRIVSAHFQVQRVCFEVTTSRGIYVVSVPVRNVAEAIKNVAETRVTR